MSEPIELRPIVPAIMLGLKKVRKLAAGVERRDQQQPAEVLRSDMEAALALATGIEDTVKNLHSRFDEIRGKGWGSLVSELVYGEAESGAAGVRRTIKMRLSGRSEPGSSGIEPIPAAVLFAYDNRVFQAVEVLEVLSGEMAWKDSPMAGISEGFKAYLMDLSDITLSMWPVIGPIYDITTGLIGYRAPDGKQLTNMERTLRVGFSVLGPAASLVKKGVRVTGNTLMILKAGRVLNIAEKERRGFIALAVGDELGRVYGQPCLPATVRQPACRSGLRLQVP